MNRDFEQMESWQRQHHEEIRHDIELCNMEERRKLDIIATLKPKFSKVGNQYCFLFGDDLQSSIAGFGDTAFQAAENFVKAFFEENKHAKTLC